MTTAVEIGDEAMSIVNLQDAQHNLPRLVDEVQDGREVVIAKGDTPVARLVPYVGKKMLRKPGFLKGRMTIAEDFDSPLPDDVADTFQEAE